MPTHSLRPVTPNVGGASKLEARIIALTMDDLESKRVMLFVADGYRRVAERAEERTPNSS